MINGNGTKNQMYDYLKEANAFLRKNGRKLVNWDCANVARYKNGKIVNGNSPIATPSGEDFNLVIGTFTKEDKRCLVIETIDAKFDEGKEVWKLKPGDCAVMECINIAASKN